MMSEHFRRAFTLFCEAYRPLVEQHPYYRDVSGNSPHLVLQHMWRTTTDRVRQTFVTRVREEGLDEVSLESATYEPPVYPIPIMITQEQKEVLEKLSSQPRRARSSFLVFLHSERGKIAESSGLKGDELLKKMSDMWADMTEEDKLPYDEVAMLERSHYYREKKRILEDLDSLPPEMRSLHDLFKESAYHQKRMRKGRKKKLKDQCPYKPKKPTSEFLIFCQDHREQVKAEYGELNPRDIQRKLGELWNSLEESDRKKYKDIAQCDRERYEKEMEVYIEEVMAAADEPTCSVPAVEIVNARDQFPGPMVWVPTDTYN